MKTYKAVIFDLFDTLVDFDRRQIPTVTIDGREIRSTAGETYQVLAQHAPHTTFDTYYQVLSAVTKELLAIRERDHLEIPARRRYEMLCDRLGMPREASTEPCIDGMLSHASSLHARLHGLSPRTHPGAKNPAGALPAGVAVELR